jgi:3'(2'), 5'-bisphosphate nucleotidase
MVTLMTAFPTLAGLEAQTVLATTRAVGWEAADILRSYYRGEPHAGDLQIEESKDGPVTAADLAVNHHILSRFQEAFAGAPFGYLTEETYKAQDSKAPIDEEWLWIIDPLDGTRDFIDKTGEYALHIALAYQNSLVLSVVVLPEAERLYYALKGEGSFREDRQGNLIQMQVSRRNQVDDLTLVASRTHRDERFQKLLDALSLRKQIYVGSVGFKIATILEKKADVYISLSGKAAPKDWDMAAPELILTEAGGRFTYADRSPIRYNTGDINQWGCLIASNGPCHDQLCVEAERLMAHLDS